MNRISRITLGVVAGLAFVMSAAAAQSIAVGKKGEAELRQETRVGSAVLGPGHYQFRHELTDGRHVLVIRSRGAHRAQPAWDLRVGEEVARVPCRVVSTEKPPRATALFLTQPPEGAATLTRIHIRGEDGSHVLVLEPES